MPIQLENIKLYSLKEIAHFSRVGIITLRRYVREGILKGHKIGVGWYVTEKGLRKFLHPEGRGIVRGQQDGLNT